LLLNKWDLNPKIASELETFAHQRGVQIVGRISYDKAITEAQINGETIIEYQKDGVSAEIRRAWDEVSRVISEQGTSTPVGLSAPVPLTTEP
jgi:MinD superfamily P-loop ATPase